ncbi:MAG: indole-3-glycerol phosphate synthase TrpC [Clostridiales bacterium]|nr:indole-3-glycerol phosphate synthase TrpC [Clostridiales bacterium]
MSDILETIAESTRERVEKARLITPENVIRDQAFELYNERGRNLSVSFRDALAAEGMSFICECKKASPSKGLIAEDFPYLEIAKDYEAAGASAISVLTEPRWFKGDLKYLKEISSEVKIPTLRKDFTVSPYMIYEAYLNGASAVLLICSLLDGKTLEEYIGIASSLGLDALVEAHDSDEVKMAVDAGAKIIGVNNRNLRTFEVNASNCLRLRNDVPEGVLFVAESGIKTREDIKTLLENRVNAVLIGEALMTSSDKKAYLNKLKYD